jgi:hypothetical protein
MRCVSFRRKTECGNLGPVWRRSLLECEMGTRSTRFEVGVVIVFLIVAAALLAYFLPGFLGLH